MVHAPTLVVSLPVWLSAKKRLMFVQNVNLTILQHKGGVGSGQLPLAKPGAVNALLHVKHSIIGTLCPRGVEPLLT